ncbi:alpha-amylase family glycosyl hydrolase [Dactylosporangium sp. CA-052675]|uniref:alpha-amylase family glycosyl hydrolase n=1 Tax=Dactylosporangium sp. CA-052675 TaxID=3239927 RepID=UPI003D94EE2D
MSWWQVYPLGFVGAPVRPGGTDAAEQVVHRLGRIEAWLDHVVGLGLDGIALGPVFASMTHGYDTVDHFRIDPRLGDDADFDRLVAAAHDRGLKVLLDGVFNHVGRAHPLVGRPGTRSEVFEGHDSLVVLDHDSPAAADLVVRVMEHWLGRGADGWRLDAAYAVPPRFWAAVLPRVRERHPGAWFVGEVIHGDYAAIVRESTMDSVTQYELWQGIWHGIADRNLFELAHALKRHNDLLAGFVPATFVGNHDVTRIASAVGADFVPHALAVLLTVAGVPSVYAGDEYGWTGVKEQRLGGDDAVRPEFPPRPPADNDMVRLHRQLLAVRRARPWVVRAHTDVVHLDNRQAVLRTATGWGALITALNLADDPVAVPSGGAEARAAGPATLDGARIQLPPRGWGVFTS